MDTTASSFTARNNAKRAAEKMIASGKAPAVDYGIRPRDDGRFEIVWNTAPTTGEVEAETAAAATAAEDSTTPPGGVAEIDHGGLFSLGIPHPARGGADLFDDDAAAPAAIFNGASPRRIEVDPVGLAHDGDER